MGRKKSITSGRLLPKVKDMKTIEVDGLQGPVSINLTVDEIRMVIKKVGERNGNSEKQ
jgi:hypothetical protein